MDRMTCIWAGSSGFGGFTHQILRDNITGVQYLVVYSGNPTGGISVTPLLTTNGDILAVTPYQDQQDQ